MNTLSRAITGALTVFLGVFLILVSFSLIWLLFYGIPIFIIGIFILFNKKEDDIEKIKK
jgi:hypothetical protein